MHTYYILCFSLMNTEERDSFFLLDFHDTICSWFSSYFYAYFSFLLNQLFYPSIKCTDLLFSSPSSKSSQVILSMLIALNILSVGWLLTSSVSWLSNVYLTTNWDLNLCIPKSPQNPHVSDWISWMMFTCQNTARNLGIIHGFYLSFHLRPIPPQSNVVILSLQFLSNISLPLQFKILVSLFWIASKVL